MAAYPSTLPCPLSDNYSFVRRSAASKNEVLRGRHRTELKDLYPSFELGLNLIYTVDQFEEWQTFWTTTINRGVDWFTMDLYLDGTERTWDVHASGPFSATLIGFDKWSTSLNLEARMP